MELSHYHRLRTAVQGNAHPGSVIELAPMETNLRDLLMASGIFEDVEVEHTDDPDQLLIALCHFRAEYSEMDVADHLERLWNGRVRYPFWEAHALALGKEQVEFEAATRNSNSGPYVTVHLVAQKAQIPEQRRP